ncbi:MAG: serine dehydratase subunit alpha family protein [Lachnospiraceae bacterium]|nr:serine dehydratase subunit alpha family protein [Lachnospiraceae bacterium]
MDKSDVRYGNYIQILKEELLPAMGCTEPIAIAYAAAKAAEVLGVRPERMLVEVSGNIIKNVKSVVVPHTGGLRGIQAAAAAGAVAGDASAKLEVISNVSREQIDEMTDYLASTEIEVRHVDNGHIFDIAITASAGANETCVRIVDFHTNIVLVRRNGEVLFEREIANVASAGALTDRECLTIEGIVDFANSVDTEDVQETLDRQISYNMAIAEEGLRGNYGANIGSVLLARHPDDITYRMRAYAAAASDARMNGCELPVVINSGSGNQGITSSVPVIVYARCNNKSHKELLRALTVSNLVTIHLKTGIGRLSAYCGAVSAGCGAGAGIAYLQGCDFEGIAHTVVNAIAIDSGIVCDGAKASCAAKIASAVDAGLMGVAMYNQGDQFFGGDGIVKDGVENTIRTIGELARRGMKQTDEEIIRLMLED